MRPLQRLPFVALNNASLANVMDFGAVGDGKADNTKAFSNAMASLPQGGVCWVPAGRYLFTGHFTIPTGVTLQGTYKVKLVPLFGICVFE